VSECNIYTDEKNNTAKHIDPKTIKQMFKIANEISWRQGNIPMTRGDRGVTIFIYKNKWIYTDSSPLLAELFLSIDGNLSENPGGLSTK